MYLLGDNSTSAILFYRQRVQGPFTCLRSQASSEHSSVTHPTTDSSKRRIFDLQPKAHLLFSLRALRAPTSQRAHTQKSRPLLWPGLSACCILGFDKRLHCPLSRGGRNWGREICGHLKWEGDPSYRGWSPCPDAKILEGRSGAREKGNELGASGIGGKGLCASWQRWMC